MSARINSLKLIFTWQRLLPLIDWPWELLLLVGLFAWLYWQTMPPGISSWIIEGWDSAVLQVTGSAWGIPHSPGYPLYTILSNLFVRLLGFVPGFADTSLVWRVSFWSTITSLLTLVFVYLATRRIARNRAAALIAGGILGLSFIFWRGAIMAEVYSLNALIFALTYWLALNWDDDRRDGWLIALGLVLGAGLAHHRTAFILPPTIALWTLLRRPKSCEQPVLPNRQKARWKIVARRWLILAGLALVPLLSYLYLPWAAANRAGQTWLYADTSEWNTFWFVVLSREWWGLVQIPNTFSTWLEALGQLFWQQAGQITAGAILLGIVGLLTSRRYLWLFGPPFLALTFFGATYKVADLDSMLIPLTLIICIGLGILLGLISRNLASWLVRVIRVKDEALRGQWLSPATRWVLFVGLIVGAYILFRPLAEANYEAVDLSNDWQAVDLVEEIVAMAQAGTPLTIIGQDNSVLPDFIYAKTVLGQPVEPLSTTTLSRMPAEKSRALLKHRFGQGRRVLVDIETIQLGFIPWLSQAIDRGHIFLAPTGHPYLWELLPRPLPRLLPTGEPLRTPPEHEFLDGQLAIVAYHQRVIYKRTGCFLRLTLFWQTKQALTEDYNVSVQPLGGETVVDKNDHLGLMRGHLPTSQIGPGEVVRDEIDMLIRQPAALPGINLVVNLYQVQGDQFPTFGQVTLPITVAPHACVGRST